MQLKDLIELGDVSEMQAFAYLSYLNGKVPEEEMQKNVDAYCDNLASSFVEKHQAVLQDEDLLIKLRRYISSIHSDKPHSGHRFYEALYKKLSEFVPSAEKQ